VQVSALQDGGGDAAESKILEFIRVTRTFAPIRVKKFLRLSKDIVDGKHPLDGSMAKA
jgi:hypothetical protein